MDKFSSQQPKALKQINTSDLVRETLIHSGAFGSIWRVSAKRKLGPRIEGSGYLAKLTDHVDNPTEVLGYFRNLEQLATKFEENFHYFNSRLALPLAVINKNPKGHVGYLMREFPDDCHFVQQMTSGPKRTLSELKPFLNSKSERARFATPLLTKHQVFHLLGDFLTTVKLLHQKQIVLGDISSSNLVIQIRAQAPSAPRMLFLDVDSFSIQGDSFLPEGQNTLLYEAPEFGSEPTFASDVYKCALVVVRMLTQLADDRKHSFDVYSTDLCHRELDEIGGKSFVDIIDLCLSVRPADRPPIAVIETTWKLGLSHIVS